MHHQQPVSLSNNATRGLASLLSTVLMLGSCLPPGFTAEAEETAPLDASVQTMFYQARSPQTGAMWDTWLYYHEGTYYLYHLASAIKTDF